MYEVRNSYAYYNKAEINSMKVNFGSLDQMEENYSIISKANEYEIVCEKVFVPYLFKVKLKFDTEKNNAASLE